MHPFIRTEWNYDTRSAVKETSTNTRFALDGCDGEEKEGAVVTERTKQSFKEEADINTIVRRFGLTGELPKDVRMPVHGDFTNLPDFRAAQDALVSARESFQEMPANVRARFHNDAAEFIDFCSDKNNRDEAIKLGLVPRPEDPAKAAAAIEAEADHAIAVEAAVSRKRPTRPSGHSTT